MADLGIDSDHRRQQETDKRAEHGRERPGRREHRADADSHQLGRDRIERSGAHRLAELAVAKEQKQRGNHHEGTEDEDEIGRIEPQRAEHQGRTDKGRVDRKRIVLPVQTDRGLDDEADRKGDDHQREFGLVYDRADQQSLGRHAEHRGADENKRHHGEIGQAQTREDQGQISTEGDDLALCEVNDTARLERQHQRQTDQRIDAADAQARQRKLEDDPPGHDAVLVRTITSLVALEDVALALAFERNRFPFAVLHPHGLQTQIADVMLSGKRDR